MKLRDIFKKYLWVKKFKILMLFFVGLFQALINIFLVYKLGDFVDLINQSGNLNKFKKYIIMFLLFNILTILLNYIKNYLYVNLQMESAYLFIEDTLSHLQKIPILKLEEFDIKKIVQKINNDINGLISLYLDLIDSFIVNLVTVIISLLVLLYLNRVFVIIVLIALIIYLICCINMKQILLKVNMEFLESKSDFFSISLLQLENIRSLKIHCIFDSLNRLLRNSFYNVRNSAIKQFKYSNIYTSIGKILRVFIQISIFFVGGNLVINGKLTLGHFTIINSFFTNILNNVDYFYNLFYQLQNTNVMLRRVNKYININIEKDSIEKIEDIESILLKNLTFKYKEDFVINDFNQKFSRNNIYLIRGKNGSGKTSLINCLIGLFKYDYEGEIFFNGINIHRLNMNYIREKKISMVEQHPNSTSFYNFLDGIEITRKTRSIIENFKLDKLFNIKENKYFIRNKDFNSLSGGEIQKLGILSSVLKKSDVLIFDEPTTNLDKVSKLFFFRLLNDIKNEKIVIVISHEDIFDSITDIFIDKY